MSELPLNQAIQRFKTNEDRANTWVNDPAAVGHYVASTTEQVETIPALNARILQEFAFVQAEGVQGYATKALMDADLVPDAGTVAYVLNDSNAANNGVYRKTGASGAGSWVVGVDRPGQALAASEAAQRHGAMQAAALGAGAADALLARPISSYTLNSTSGIYGWSVCMEPSVEAMADGFVVFCGNLASVASWDVLVYTRPSSDSSSVVPGAGANDQEIAADLVPSVTYTAAAGAQAVVVRFAKPLRMLSTYKYAFFVGARDGAAARTQIARLPGSVAGLSYWQKGFFINSGGAINVDVTINVTAGYVFQRRPAEVTANGEPRVTGAPVVTSLTLDLQNVLIHNLRGSRPLGTPSLTLTAASTGTGATASAYSLKYKPSASNISNVGDDVAWLGKRKVTITEVRRVSDSVVLVDGTDYAWVPEGKVWGLVNTADFNVDITYDWAQERYDTVVLNVVTNTAVVRAGTERPLTAHEDPYRPVLNSTDRPLWNVYVIGAEIVEVIPAWEWRGPIHMFRSAEYEALQAHNRRALRKTRARLARGLGLLVAGYGDSNTAIGGGGYTGAASFEPNRTGVDGIHNGWFYQTPTEEADFRAAILAGLETIVVNGSTRYMASPIWGLIKMIRDGHGYTIEADVNPAAAEVVYLNFGISGTTAGTTAGQGAHPDRLAVLLDPSAYGPGGGGYRAPDLVVVAFGMNGTPDANLSADLTTIVSTIKAAGIEVILLGPHLTATQGERFMLDEWLSVQADIRRVAFQQGAALVPIDMAHGPGFAGFLGISQQSLCRSNYINHPGPYERRMVGELLGRVLEP